MDESDVSKKLFNKDGKKLTVAEMEKNKEEERAHLEKLKT